MMFVVEDTLTGMLMKHLITKDDLLNESISEVFLLKAEVDGLDDESLIDEIMEISAYVDLYEKVDNIVAKYFTRPNIDKKSRKTLEAAYMLFHVEHCVEE